MAGPVLRSCSCLASRELATGWVEVAPGEVVVVRRLGRVLPEPWMPGPHLGWPLGLDRAVRVRTDEVRRLAVGLAGAPGAGDEPGAGEYLTGDLNLLRAAGSSSIASPTRSPSSLRRGRSVEPILARLAESSLARVLSAPRDRRGLAARSGGDRPRRSRRNWRGSVATRRSGSRSWA